MRDTEMRVRTPPGTGAGPDRVVSFLLSTSTVNIEINTQIRRLHDGLTGSHHVNTDLSFVNRSYGYLELENLESSLCR